MTAGGITALAGNRDTATIQAAWDEMREAAVAGLGKLPYDMTYGMKSFPSDAMLLMLGALGKPEGA